MSLLNYSKVGKKWEDSDIEKLKALYKNESLSIIDIAKRLERLPNGIIMKLKRLKLIKKETDARGYDENKIQEMESNYYNNKPKKEIKKTNSNILDEKIESLIDKIDVFNEEMLSFNDKIIKMTKQFNAVVNALHDLHNKIDYLNNKHVK